MQSTKILFQRLLIRKSVLEIGKLSKRNIKISSCSYKINVSHQEKEKSITVSHVNTYTYRTHTCDELRSSDVNKNVVLCGWVQNQRINFLILRDGYGSVQIIIPHGRDDLKKIIENSSLESVLLIEGVVVNRPKDQFNSKLSTGEVEVIASNIIILNKADSQMPFQIRNYSKAKEDLRLKYRYLDFRFPEMQYNLRYRSNFLMKVREFLIQERNFIEVETPTLFKRTPGGAREFIVPTHEKNKFYSLVQSPQQLKQLLMVGSIDRYFQIARCYRDESTKPNRQPEFTQLDLELSFTNRESIMNLIEEVLCFCLKIPFKSFPIMTYDHAMNYYGSDKPDLRYDCKIINIDDYVNKENINKHNITNRLLILPNGFNKITNKIQTEYKTLAKKSNVKLLIIKIQNGNENLKMVENILNKFNIEISYNKLINNIKTNINDVLVFATGETNETLSVLGQIRTDFHKDLDTQKLNLKDPKSFNILWIIDFPLFLPTDEGTLEPAHHPFTQPHPEDIHLLSNDPLKVRGLHYDLVLNGNEIGGGSIRIHNSDLQELIFQILNIEKSSLHYMIEAFKYGCPPHGGIALGIDRLMSILCNTKTIRDVIAFPKGFNGQDQMTGSPNDISKEEKEYYHLK